MYKTRQARDKHQQPLTQAMKKKKWQFYRDKADQVFARYIRERDKHKNCVSYGAKNCKNKIQHACHYIGRAYYLYRWDERNVHWWCASCNTFNQQEHQQYYTLFMDYTYWREVVNEMLINKNKINKKPSLEDLFAIINRYDTTHT